MRVDHRVARLLDAVYAEPSPFDSAEHFARAHHDDIAELGLDEIDAERILARIRWAVFIYRRAEPSELARRAHRATRPRRRASPEERPAMSRRVADPIGPLLRHLTARRWEPVRVDAASILRREGLDLLLE